MNDDAKLDELFRNGLKAAARPYVRAAAAHRNALMAPAPKVKMTTRLRDCGAGFASAHRRALAALTTALALTGAAAYAMPNIQTASRAKVDPEASQNTFSYESQPASAGHGTRPGAAPLDDNTPGLAVGVIGPRGSLLPGGSSGNATQPGGTTPSGTKAGGATHLSGTSGPSAPPDNTAPPQYNTTNAVRAVLHDGNVLTVSAQNDGGQLDQWVDEGPVEIGFQDERTQPASDAAVLWLAAVTDAGRNATLTQPVAIDAGTTQVLHLVFVNHQYTLSAHVGGAVVDGDNAFSVRVPAATDTNSNNPYLVKTTLDPSGFELNGTPALHQGDEPCLTSDTYVPTVTDAWVALAMNAQQRPYLSVHNVDGRAWMLHIVGYGAYVKGNLQKGKDVKFQLPTRPAGSPFGKYVLQYTLNDDPGVARTIVIWNDAK